MAGAFARNPAGPVAAAGDGIDVGRLLASVAVGVISRLRHVHHQHWPVRGSADRAGQRAAFAAGDAARPIPPSGHGGGHARQIGRRQPVFVHGFSCLRHRLRRFELLL